MDRARFPEMKHETSTDMAHAHVDTGPESAKKKSDHKKRYEQTGTEQETTYLWAIDP